MTIKTSLIIIVLLIATAITIIAAANGQEQQEFLTYENPDLWYKYTIPY
jgi:hypothetical protein